MDRRGFAGSVSALRVGFSLACIFAVRLGLPAPSYGVVRPPAQVAFTTTDEFAVGRPMKVSVVLEAKDFPEAMFELIVPPSDWEFLNGPERWSGSLEAGKPVKLQIHVKPRSRNPEPIRGRLSLAGWPDTDWLMDMHSLRPSAHVAITSPDELEAGKAMKFVITLDGDDFPEARFELQVPEKHWKFAGGQDHWEGTLTKGQPVQLEAYLVPAVAHPSPIRGRLHLPGRRDIDSVMEVRAPRNPATTGAATGTPSPEATAAVTATGRFVYYDDSIPLPQPVGIRHALVRMWDTDFFVPCIGTFGMCRELMGVSETDDNGYFTVTGIGSDGNLFNPGDLPDPFVEVVAESASAVVQTGDGISTYCFKSSYVDNAGPGATLNFGTISPGPTGGCSVEQDVRGENGAWQLYNNARESWEFMRAYTLATPGRDVPQVRVLWPASSGTFYSWPFLDNGRISVGAANTWAEWVIMHEYGHHILYHFSEIPSPDYNNGVCDSPSPTHCLWSWELGAIHWTEGWPDFLSSVLTAFWNKNNPLVVETPPEPPPDTNFPLIEGYTAAVLWDQYDVSSDDHDGNGSRDRLNQNFAVQWDVIVNYDPSPGDGSHNHPITIGEFWNGYAARNPLLANRLSEIYDENHLTGMPAADLQTTSLTTSVTSVFINAPIVLNYITTNAGAVATGVSSTTRFYLSADLNVTTGDLPIGQTIVPSLSSESGYGTLASYTVPESMLPGTYYLGACSDAPGLVFESNEANNCRVVSTPIAIQANRVDLTVSALSNPPTGALLGDSFALNNTTQNFGAATAGPSTTRFYLSRDRARSSDDTLLTGTQPVPNLVPLAYYSATTLVTVPSMGTGDFYVIACADDTRAVLEDYEANNCHASLGSIWISGPDLVETWVNDPPATAGRGGTFGFTDTVNNFGLGAAAPSTTRFYLSLDSNRSGGDILLEGTKAVPQLEPGDRYTGLATIVRVPLKTLDGTYYLLACVDDLAVVTESSETNNCRASLGRVSIAP